MSLAIKVAIVSLALSGGPARPDAGVAFDGGRPMPTWKEYPVKWKMFDAGFLDDRVDEW